MVYLRGRRSREGPAPNFSKGLPRARTGLPAVPSPELSRTAIPVSREQLSQLKGPTSSAEIERYWPRAALYRKKFREKKRARSQDIRRRKPGATLSASHLPTRRLRANVDGLSSSPKDEGRAPGPSPGRGSPRANRGRPATSMTRRAATIPRGASLRAESKAWGLQSSPSTQQPHRAASTTKRAPTPEPSPPRRPSSWHRKLRAPRSPVASRARTSVHGPRSYRNSTSSRPPPRSDGEGETRSNVLGKFGPSAPPEWNPVPDVPTGLGGIRRDAL